MDEKLLLCHRVSELPIPRIGAIQRNCAFCNEPVWVQAKNLQHQLKLICHKCCRAENKKDLAHHGRKEWGSPIEPENAEAWAIHAADMMSSKFIS